MSKKTWNDQPEQCEKAETLCSFLLNSGLHVEVRGMPEPEDRVLFSREYFVTTGNLFGSQTVRCFGEEKLFEVLRLTNTTRKGAKLPAGVEILENAA